MAAAMRGRRGFSSSYAPHVVFLLFSVQLILLTMAAADTPDPRASAFLKDVVKMIATREKWGPAGAAEGVRVSGLNVGKVRFRSSQGYEFYVNAAKKVWVFRFSDDVAAWKKVRKGGGAFLPDLFSESENLGRRHGVKAFELEGPLELQGVGDYDLSLRLPLNTTHTGLKRILIGEGIKIRLEGVEEASLVLPSNLGLLNRSSMTVKEHTDQFWPQQYSKCLPLLSVYIQGSASITANRIHDPSDYIETEFHTPDILELLSENYNDGNHFRFHPNFSIGYFSARLNLVEKILRRFMKNKLIEQDGPPQLVKVKIASSTIVKLRLELEREIHSDDKIWKKVAEWKTRPPVERAQFEVVARVEEGKPLKPLKCKRMKKPFVTVDTTAWSNLMSNISFTKFSTVVVPPEPLTLDVKW